jgi:hypothetical protein
MNGVSRKSLTLSGETTILSNSSGFFFRLTNNSLEHPHSKIIFAHKITVSLYFIIVDATNQLMYPSPKLIKVQNGWYILPGYDAHAQELVFSDAGFRNLHVQWPEDEDLVWRRPV